MSNFYAHSENEYNLLNRDGSPPSRGGDDMRPSIAVLKCSKKADISFSTIFSFNSPVFKLTENMTNTGNIISLIPPP